MGLVAQVAPNGYSPDSTIGLLSILNFEGVIACAGNPNYPAADKGDAYVVSTAGKIGGGAGPDVDVGDLILAIADAAAGTHGAVGASWLILEHNLVGALLAANNLSDVNAAAARGNLGVAAANVVGGKTWRLIGSGVGASCPTAAATIVATLTRNAGEVVKVFAFCSNDSTAMIWTESQGTTSVWLDYRRTAVANQFQFVVSNVSGVTATVDWMMIGVS